MSNIFTAKRMRVPGLLDDSALQEQLKTYTSEQQAQQNAAPPPSSATDFADKITRDFVRNPPPEVTRNLESIYQPAPETTPKERRATQDALIESRSNALVDAARTILPYTPAGAYLGAVTEMGTLSAEESQAATVARAEDAKQQEQAFRSKADIRRQLRGLTDEQAGQMGLPVAPGGTDMATSGREMLLDASRVQEAQRTTQQAERAVAGEKGAPKVTQTWWLNAAQTAAKSFAGMGVDAAKYPVIQMEQLADFYGAGNGERSDARAWLDVVDKSITKLLPGDPARANDFVTQLSAGAGSMVGFMTMAYVSGTAGLPAFASTGALGAAVSGTQQFEDAEAHNATGYQKLLALLIGSGLGVTEAIPIDRMLMRANVGTGGLVQRMLTTSRAGSIEEFIQELSQSIGEDVTAKYLAGYDPDRELDPTKWLTQAAVGGILGAAGGGAATVVDAAAERQAAEPDRITAVQGAIAQAQQIINSIPGITEVNLPVPPTPQQVNGEPAAPTPVERPPVPAPLMMRADTPAGAVEVNLADLGISLPQAQQEQTQQNPGGTPPAVGADGMVDLTHWSRAPRQVLDPAFRGTGPLIGQERRRLFGDDAVDRVYYGVGSAPAGQAQAKPKMSEFKKQWEAENPAPARMTPRERQTRRQDMERAYYDLDRTGGYKREGALGPYRHVVKADPRELYNWSEDPLGLWEQTLDPNYPADLNGGKQPESERRTRMERLIRDAGFKGAYFPRTDLGQTAIMFDQRQPAQVFDDRTGQLVPMRNGDADVLAMTTAEAKRRVGEAVPGIRGALAYMTPDERAKLRADTAQKIVDLFSTLPDPKEMAAVAIAGSAKRGWYARSAKALVDIFGVQDAPRFAALLAALSPQTSVESNTVNGLMTWVNWDAAGRPTDKAAIMRIMGQSVQGAKGADSVLPAWVNNTVTALSTPDPTAIELSGPKVSSFMKNLQGVTIEVTNDTWMANFANVPQTLFKKTGASPGKGPGYIAFNVLVRRAAASASKMTGDTWTPAEIQETVWSWTKALYEKVDGAGELRSATEIVKAGALTDAEIASTPDFATLFQSNVYKSILEKGGYSVPDDVETSGGSAGGANGRQRPDAEGESGAAARGSIQKQLERAAARLDKLRAGALEAAPEIADEIPFFDDVGTTIEPQLTEQDWADVSLLAQVATTPTDLERLSGLPENSTGPIESVVTAARAYAHSIGIPLRRQSSYVKVDPERAGRIAQAYAEMKHDPSDPAVAASYDALIAETLAQYQFVKASGLQVDFIEQGQPDPYNGDLKKVLRDIQQGHLWLFPTDQGFGTENAAGSDNPLLRPTDEVLHGRQLLANDVFRIVHDFFGHGLEGSGFGARGEENAWQSHMRLFTDAAVPALTSETRGQNSWVNYGPHGVANRANPAETVFADQKTGIMPDWTWQEGVTDAPSDVLGMMGGVRAATVNNAKLQQAIDMLDRGTDRDDVWNETGFYRGVDGLLRFEIRDDEATWTPFVEEQRQAQGRNTRIYGFVSQVLQHPKLFAAYPQLANVSVSVTIDTEGTDLPNGGWMPAKTGGLYSEDQNFIKVSAPYADIAMSVLLHEVQHAVQAIENFARGGNTDMGEVYEGEIVESAMAGAADMEKLVNLLQKAVNGDDTKAALDAVRELPEAIRKRNQMRDYVRKAAAYEYYRRIAGEVEARNTQKRYAAFKDIAERQALGWRIDPTDVPDAPWWTQDVNDSQQVVISRSEDGAGYRSQSVAPPFEQMLTSARERISTRQKTADAIASGSRAVKLSNGRLSALVGPNTVAGEKPFRVTYLGVDGQPNGHVEAETLRDAAVRAMEDGFYPDGDLLASQASGTSASRAPYRAEPTRPSAGIPDTGQAVEPNDVSLAQISKNFIGLLNLVVRQGRFTLQGSNVMGQYSRRQAVARLRTWNDLSTLVHEGGHALHDMMDGQLAAFTRANETALMDVANKLYGRGIVDTAQLPRADHVREGFAEFFRVYTLNRAYAEREYPALTAELASILQREAPQIGLGLDAVGMQFAAYLQLPSVQAIRNTVVPGERQLGINAAIEELRQVGFKSWMSEYARRGVQASVNRYASLNTLVADMLNVAQENLGGALDLKRADDPRTLARLAPNAGSRAMVQITDGVMAYRGLQPTTRSLRDALLTSQGVDPQTTPSNIDEERAHDFSAYLVALRARDEYRRFDEGKIARPPISNSIGDVNQAIADFEARYGDAFVNGAVIVNEYAMALWEKQYQAGLMSKETYTDGLDRQFYAPLQRDMSDKAGDFSPTALTGGRSLVKRFRGSDRQIVDPLAILMHKTFALEMTIAQNDAVKALAQLADKAGSAGAMVERIPATKMVGKMLSVEDVAKKLTKDDTISPADAQDLMTILSASIANGNFISLFRSEQAATLGENILFYWENGKVQAIQLKDGDVGADVMNLMNAVGRENMPLGMELVAGTSTVFRTAITSWPDFLVVNFIRDQMSAWIMSDVGYIPFATGLKGVHEEIRQKQWARMANSAMMTMGGMNVATLHDARIRRDIQSLRSKGYIARIFNEKGVTGKIKGLGRLTEMTETGTRLGLFQNTYERAKRDGLNDWEAAIEASYIATDYMDFGLNGSRMMLFRRTIPFLNAQLQGYYKLIRTLGADEVRQRKGLKFVLGAYFKSTKNLPLSREEKLAINTGRKAWLKMASLGLISALLHFLQEDDPDYQEAGEYLRVTGWVLALGEGRVLYIPKPFELAMIANATERALEAASGDSEAKNRFLRGAAMTMVPPTAPPAIQSVVEYVANRDFFTGQEIVPGYMQGRAANLQYNNYTSSFARRVGEMTGWSPMVVDHFMSSFGASAYRDMVTMTNALDPNRPTMDETDAPIARRFIRDMRRGSASSRDFWAQASTTNGRLTVAAGTYKNYVEQANQPAADRYLASLEPDEKAYALLNTHFDAEEKRLNPMYRARQINTVVAAMRREMVSDLGLENTSKFDKGQIPLSASQKADLDEALSEYARREMRNTMVAMKMPGWAGKRMLDTEKTKDMLETLVPAVREEFDRRIAKAKVYDAQTVFDAWPDARDRLIMDRDEAFLTDLVTIAKVAR